MGREGFRARVPGRGAEAVRAGVTQGGDDADDRREGWARRWGPEAALAVLACVVFLGFLGSVDLWGKREQRASAEAIDTIDHGHWLVAQIQGRPRLEKPPLPRWTIATLMR